MNSSRIGVFGGTFDPPHVGHQLVVQDAKEALGLDHVVIVPAGTQPLKQNTGTPAQHRMAMTRLCFEGIPGMTVDPIEVDRGGISFMVDTVEALARRYSGSELCLLVGDDVVATLPRWREPARMLSTARLAVLRRGEHSDSLSAMLKEWEQVEGVLEPLALSTRRVDVTSTEIRRRLAEGKSVIGFLPDAVLRYIKTVGLYPVLPVAAERPGFA